MELDGIYVFGWIFRLVQALSGHPSPRAVDLCLTFYLIVLTTKGMIIFVSNLVTLKVIQVVNLLGAIRYV